MHTKSLLVALALVLLAGCASQSAVPAPAVGDSAAASGMLPKLPQPAALLKQLHSHTRAVSSAKFTEADVEQQGFLYDATLPHQNTADNGTALRFIPNIANPGDGAFDGLAFATYHFELPQYDRNPEVRLKWKVAPQSSGDYFVALANWNRDRWDWKPGTDAGRISFGTMAPYKSFSDDIVVIVALIGTEDAQLDTVRMGGLPPVAALTVAQPTGAVPFAPVLDASASTDPDGLALTYQFDFDGDGTFESIPGGDPTPDYNYSSNGDYQPAVKVTNSIHASSIASVSVHALSDWSRSFGGAGQDQFQGVTYDQDRFIYAVGNFDTPQPNLLLTKWTPAGALVWAKEWDSGEEDYGVQISSDWDGNLVVAGQTNKNGVRQALVQKYTTDGVKVWSRRFGSSGKSTMLLSMQLDEEAIYCAGMATINSDSDLFVTKLNYDGDLLWSTYRDAGGTDVFDDMALAYSNFGGPAAGVSLLGESQINGDSNLWKVRIDGDGNYLSAYQLGTSAEPKYNGKLVFTNDFLEGAHYYVAGQTKVSGTTQFFVLGVDSDLNNIWGKRYPSLDLRPYYMGSDGSGNLVVGGGYNQGISLFKLTPGGVDLKHSTLSNASAADHTYGMVPFTSGLLVTGSAPNSTIVQGQQALPSPSSFYEGFTFLGTAGGSAGYAAQDTSLDVVSDVSASGVLNSGGGVSDGLLTWRHGI
jgi:hypothetical protein